MAAEPTPRSLPRLPRQHTSLRPGLVVVRRDDRHLQIGVDPPYRLIVEDHPDVRRLLGDLRAGAAPEPTTDVGHRVLAALRDADLLVDATELDRSLAGAADRAAGLAVWAQFGDGAAARLAARAGARVGVDAPADLGQGAARLLRAAGVGGGTGAGADVVLVVTDGELARDLLDPFVRAGQPHLLVAGGPGGVTVGPFVVPGVTACRRCVDAHLGEADPRRALVVEQCADAPGAGTAPRDPALMAIAVAWAVRDLVGFLDGDRPATWSTTLHLGPGLEPDRRSWTRHPHCGCSWGDLLAV